MTTVDNRVPVTVVTGAFSSGKTTSINHLMLHHSGTSFAVIENQVGEIAVSDPSIPVWSVAEDVCQWSTGGCACVSVRRDLVRTIARVMQPRCDGSPPPEAILIETSGHANPAHIVETLFYDPSLRRIVRLNAVVAVVDASQAATMQHALAHDPNHTTLRQIALADCILLNNCNLAEHDHVQALVAHIRLLCGTNTPIVHCDASGMFASDHVLHMDAYAMDRVASTLQHGDGAQHEAVEKLPVQRMELTVPGELQSLSVHMWLTQLLKQHAGDVFSIKGLLCIAGSPHKHVFTGVHMMVQFGVASRAWAAGEARMSRVVITCNDQLDREELLAALRECASRPFPSSPLGANTTHMEAESPPTPISGEPSPTRPLPDKLLTPDKLMVGSQAAAGSPAASTAVGIEGY